MRMAGGFRRYAPEDEKSSTASKTPDSAILLSLAEAFGRFPMSDDHCFHLKDASRVIRGLKLTSMDISDFCLSFQRLCGEDDHMKKGVFITALIHVCREKTFTINTEGLGAASDIGEGIRGKRIRISGDVKSLLGNGMRGGIIELMGDAGDNAGSGMKGGEISIFGNCGDEAGREMEGGRISVIGDASNRIGEKMREGEIVVWGNAGTSLGIGMRGGSIEVHGNAGDFLGSGFDELSRMFNGPNTKIWPMRGGLITVHGDAGKYVGAGMKGGEIRINGNIGSIAKVVHGRVFHRGKLIVDR